MSQNSRERAGWEIRDEIGILTLDNPPENYIYEPEFVPLPVLETWISDTSLKGILIHGAGKHFSAGGDLTRLFDRISENADLPAMMQAGHQLIARLHALHLPMVAAIHGVCFGGGLELALACHIRIAGEHALFAFPETGLHLIPGMGGTLRLPSVTGLAQATRLILSGEIIGAEEALLIGLIDEIRPRQELFDQAFQLLKRMTAGISLPVIQAVMQTLQRAETLRPEEAIREETALFCKLALAEAARRAGERNPVTE